MSETETNTGTLTPVNLLNGESNEGYAFRLLNGKKDEWSKTYLDELLESGYRDYVLHNGTLYQVDYERDSDDSDIFQAREAIDGTIHFTLRYYNGGCSFSEAIETALEKMKL